MRKLKLLLAAALMLSSAFPVGPNPEKLPEELQMTKGNPIIGVTVNVKNSRTGTTTAPDGSFKINAAPNAVLVDGAPSGSNLHERNPGRTPKQTSQNLISLVQDTKLMSEVVVTGTGVATSKKAGYFRRIYQWR